MVRRSNAQLGIGSQAITAHSRQLGFATMAAAVFERERAEVDAVGLDRQARVLAASCGAFFRLGVQLKVFVTPLLLRRLQQLSNTTRGAHVSDKQQQQCTHSIQPINIGCRHLLWWNG